jgi:hypothetical protein
MKKSQSKLQITYKNIDELIPYALSLSYDRIKDYSYTIGD